jgi:hypothetical protein
MARPRKQIDPKKVESLAAEGCTAEEIAACLDVRARLIETRFHASVKTGRQKLHRFLKREMVRHVRRGNVAALIFGLKAYCGLRETDPVSINVAANAVTAFGLNDEQKKQISRLAQQIEYRVFHRPQPEPAHNGANGDPPATPALN